MSLEVVLASIERLEDVSRLAGALGVEPRWEPLVVSGWLGPNAPECIARAAVVGVASEFAWFAIEAPAPGRTAATVARRLASWGRPAGVLALDPRLRRLGAAVAFGDIPRLECALDQPERLPLACLARLRDAGIQVSAIGASGIGAAAVSAAGIGVIPGGNGAGVAGVGAESGGTLSYAARAADALAGEGVGRRFFRTFRATLDRAAALLPAACPEAERHALALLQLTRVLFLYLVQSKGWLDGRHDFLAREVDRCLARKRHLHRDLLRPLFFGTLNRPAAERGRVPRGFGRLPFLNGGLFEPHPLERRWPADLPNGFWREAFDSLFERFHFTTGEGGEPGVIAPDVLGRVFEGVMEPATRRESGTFYTPAALVRSMVRAAFTAVLSERLRIGAGRAERLLTDRHPVARRALADLTILDPAVGSGAFLLGALDLLAGLHAGTGAARRVKRRILRRNLYGVDLNPTAVRLTELRLWLAVIADEPCGDPERVEPLPNLDCLIRQGDSLLDPLAACPGLRPAPAAAAALARLRRDLVTAVGGGKRALARRLRRAESHAFGECLEAAEAALAGRIRAILDSARDPTLFSGRRGLDSSGMQELLRLRGELRGVRALRRRFRRDGELPWFHYESHFADVFARGGFDVVVGNPPWVRAERLAPDHRARLAERYRWWHSGVARGFAHRPDLSLAFVERAWELTRPGGAVALLVPAKLATAAYGARARCALAAQATLHVVADLTVQEARAFDATAYPLALVATKTPPPAGHRARLTLASRDAPTVAQQTLAGGGPWILVRDGARAAAAALAPGAPRLADRLRCQLGVKTGANHVFLRPPADIEPALLRRAVRGRDVRAFRVEGGVRLLWPYDARGTVLRTLPPNARAHFERFERDLRARADYVDGPPWVLFRTAAATAPYRVVWADVARRLTAVALVSGPEPIPLNTCYVVAAPSAGLALRLAAWLNCTWIRAAARLAAPPASGGFARFGAHVVGELPLPDAVLADPSLEQLARDAAAGSSVQHDLDAHTAHLLGLSAAAQAALAGVAGVGTDDRC